MSYTTEDLQLTRDVQQREALEKHIAKFEKQKVYGKRQMNIHSDFKDRIRQLQNSIK